MAATGYEHAETQALEKIRDNLLAGLERVASSLDDGTFQRKEPRTCASGAHQHIIQLLTPPWTRRPRLWDQIHYQVK